MALESGTQLGHYEITDLLGKGGMGEVYRARDTKLGRDVAIKVLPAEFSQDQERLARLEREARMLAALNHPNIAAIYGLEQSEDTRFLVLELIEGDTLADRLTGGAIPVEESLKLALQIAEALEAAHEKGVIHRDLKPANIKITPEGRVKVLDFGLAKAFMGDQADVNLSNSPTLSMAATQAGIILGTAAYMSPEQASGEVADHRADVWAFGVVLFEMLTGRQLFTGKTASHVMGAVLEREPDWTSLPANLHARMRVLLERLLEKEAKDRLSSISDARVELQKVLADPTGVTVHPVPPEATQLATKSKLRLVAGVVLGVVLSAFATWTLKPESPGGLRLVSRSDYDLPEGVDFRNTGVNVVAVSPDSRYVVYNGTGGLYLRSLDELDARLIAGTEGDITNPFFSPDSQWVGFWQRDGRIFRVAVSGGTPIQITDMAPENPRGISWDSDGMILFEQTDGIYRVAANGGIPERIIEAQEGEQLAQPQLLPAGQGLLYTANAGGWDSGQIIVQAVDPPGGRKVVWNGLDARYVPTGHLTYALDDDLFAIGFDLETLDVVGGAVSLEQGLARSARGHSANYALSDNGSLVYVRGTGGGVGSRSSLLWIDRQGNEEIIGLEPAPYYWPRLSPDRTRLVVSMDDTSNQDVWISDLTRDPPTRTKLTTDPSLDNVPIWTLDGERVVFASEREGGQLGFFSKLADGTGAVDFLVAPDNSGFLMPFGWSPDATKLVFGYAGGATAADIGIVSMEGDTSWEPLIASDAQEYHPTISPNGEWIAYDSDFSGNREVYVERFPDLGGRVQVSTGGGQKPMWDADGAELFYEIQGGALIGVPIVMEPTLRPGEARMVLEPGTLETGSRLIVNYDYDSVNRRFLVIRAGDLSSVESTPGPQIITVLNWVEELKERVPVP